MPHLVQVAAEAEQDGGQVIGISQDLFAPGIGAEQALQRVQEFVGKRGIRFPVYVLDDETLDGINALWDLPGPIPATVALDAQGRIVDMQEGSADLPRLREMMQRALGKLPAAK